MGRVRLTKAAMADLKAIWHYIAVSNEVAADRLLHTLSEHYVLLSDNTKLGRARPEIRRDLRCFPVKNYLIFYRSIADGIEVVRVVHGSRDLQSLFESEDQEYL